MTSSVGTVARHEWRLLRRSRLAAVALILLIILAAIAALTSMAHRDANADIRTRFQANADASFDGQPARHPHRVVHYGHFVFRPLAPLAAFDPGVDGFTGNMIYLEGHRQNSANFGDVRQSSLLARFGQLTPAFVLQLLAPLVLIFIGFGIVARDREAGTLRQSLALGASARQLLIGKLLALGGIAAIMLVPGLVALIWLTAGEGAPITAALGLLGGYSVYLALWALIVLAASAIAPNARTALLSLLGVWAVTAILIPRAVPALVLTTEPIATRLETDVAIQEDLRRMGDSHDPDDPHFTALKAATLARYGVERVADLPFNYRGYLAMEGERMTSQLFDDYADRQFAQQRAQSGMVGWASVLSPTIAIQRLSMATSGTDLEGHRRFLQQAEAYRYTIVQQLNRLQMEALNFADDSARNDDLEAARRVRINTSNWQEIPDFQYVAASPREKLLSAAPSAAVLVGWLFAAFALFGWAARRLQASVQ